MREDGRLHAFMELAQQFNHARGRLRFGEGGEPDDIGEQDRHRLVADFIQRAVGIGQLLHQVGGEIAGELGAFAHHPHLAQNQ